MSPILLLSATLAMPSAHAGAHTLDVETWNVGLAHGFVDDAAARLPGILEALKEADVDVICLQEVWEPADRDRIRDA